MASSRAVRCRRLVTSTKVPAAPGSNGRTCSLSAASSSSSSNCLPASRSRHSAILASSPGGMCSTGTPAVSSRLPSASAGATGCCPGVCPCRGKKICPSGNRGASWCAACTANVVFPIPAIPPIAWIPTTPPEPELAAVTPASWRNSCSRPVNEAISRGSVRVAAATPSTLVPGARDPPATARPLETVSTSTRVAAGRARRVRAIAVRSACGSTGYPSSSRLRASRPSSASPSPHTCPSCRSQESLNSRGSPPTARLTIVRSTFCRSSIRASRPASSSGARPDSAAASSQATSDGVGTGWPSTIP